jgi:hypothetical protein
LNGPISRFLAKSLTVILPIFIWWGTGYGQDNSRFYGTYNLSTRIGPCQESDLVIVGNDENAFLNGDSKYLLLPTNGSTFSYNQVYEDGDISTFTINVSENVMHFTILTEYPDEPGGGSSYDYLITFSSDYTQATVSGYASSSKHDEECQGSIEGTFTRVGGPVTPVYAVIQGKVTDALTGEPIQGATISLEPGSISLTAMVDGTFSSSSITAGTYTAQISAANYNPKVLSGFAIAFGAPNQLDASLDPYAPQVTSATANPNLVTNDGQGTTLLAVRVTHPLGLTYIYAVRGDFSAIGGSAQQPFYDDATHGDVKAGDGTYSFQSIVTPGTKARLYSLNVTAFDEAENQGFGSISLNVIDKVSGVVQPTQPDSKTFDNPLGGQTLTIHYALLKTALSLRGIRSDCEVQLTVLGPNGEHYGPYSVTDSIDVSIPNAPAGQWTYQTNDLCASAQSYEIETSGSGTGLLVGRVTDGLTGLGVKGASVNCNTGGSTVSLDQGYYSGVAVAGTGIVTTAKTGYRTNIKSGVHVKSGTTTSLNIQVVSQDASAQAAPNGANVFHILDPAEDPKPPAQPVSAKVSGSSLELNAIFPRYQQAVDLYLGFTPSSGAHAGKLFLIDENNSFVEFTGPLQAWKTHSTQEESGQIPIPNEYPYGGYTLYSLVTTDSSSLANFDLSYFTTTPPQAPPIGQNVTFIPSPTEEPNPLTQPLAVKIAGGNLILNAHFPLQKEPVSIFLAYMTPTGALYLIKSDNTAEQLSGGLWPWQENVTGEVTAQVISIPTNQTSPGAYYFYSLATTDPVTLSNYDLIFFNLDVQPQ